MRTSEADNAMDATRGSNMQPDAKGGGGRRADACVWGRGGQAERTGRARRRETGGRVNFKFSRALTSAETPLPLNSASVPSAGGRRGARVGERGACG